MDDDRVESIDRATEILEFLSQSDNRATVLSALAAEGRLDRYELEETVDATRRTLLRTLNALQERGYVDESADGFGLTALGEHVVEHYTAFVEGIALAPTVEEFLASIPADALGIDVENLRSGTVTASAPGSPYAPLDRTLELREAASEIRELAPGIERRSVEQLAERVRNEDDVEAEIVVTEDVLDAAERVETYSDAHETIVAADRVDLAVHPGPFDVALGIADDVVFVVAEATDGQPAAILETDDPAVRRWAHRVVDRHSAAATAIDPD